MLGKVWKMRVRRLFSQPSQYCKLPWKIFSSTEGHRMWRRRRSVQVEAGGQWFLSSLLRLPGRRAQTASRDLDYEVVVTVSRGSAWRGFQCPGTISTHPARIS